ncbi:MAG: leucine-rich repeat domain-containing protein, partial [Clostridia bacterium]|nr:leucine-rich repeat domain-containing protein [Clostridia bacterium]
MKKRIWIYCLAVMLLMILPFSVNAEITGPCGENAMWKYDNEHTQIMTISGTGEIRELDLYEQFLGRSWVSDEVYIEPKAIIIEDGITGIGDGVFSEFLPATSVTIPNSVVDIVGNPFSGCTCLENVIISPDHPVFEMIDGVLFSKTDKRLIAYPAGLTAETYRIPDGTRSIGDRAFSDCKMLHSITIPDSVINIGGNPFINCNHLNSIIISPEHPMFEMIDGVLFSKTDKRLIAYPAILTTETYQVPDGTQLIGDHAFSGCELTTITIPDGVTSIGNEAFYWCSSLTSITIPDSVTSIGDGAFSSCMSLKSVTIPDGVVDIGFYGCSSLERITVSPDHPVFETIDGVLFSKTDKRLILYPGGRTAETYRIPDGTRSIGDAAFSDCRNLTSVTIPDGVISIGDAAFSDCRNLTSVTIPDSVTSIGKSAFSSCDALTSVTIPDSVTSIGDEAFSFCWNLTSVTILHGVTSISDHAFSFCWNLTSVTIPDSVITIGEGAFDGCNLTTITIPDSVTSIGDGAFSCCRLTTITIPDSVTSIGDYAFCNCDGLTSITIPDSVTSIGYGAFCGCYALTSVTISDGVTSIGDGAFSYCKSLKSVTIPDSVVDIGTNPFVGCSSLERITVSPDHPVFETIDGVLFSKTDKRLILYPGGRTAETYRIPDGTRSIGDEAFSSCDALTSITIP